MLCRVLVGGHVTLSPSKPTSRLRSHKGSYVKRQVLVFRRMSTLDTLVADLRAEREALDEVVVDLDAEAWSQPTPARGWTIQDQIWHLTWFDGAARRTIAEPERFAAEAIRAQVDFDAYVADLEAEGRALLPAEVLAAWREGNDTLRDAALAADTRQRVAWYVTEMSVTSLVSARVMETWAHGQDVRDTLGVASEVSDRLRHVAHIGANAMRYAFVVHRLDAPSTPVRVELELPSGALFTFGPEGVDDRVRGQALDFCLVVTQRRHVDDVELDIEGSAAQAWMPIAQAFAGPPGVGRLPGQFGAAPMANRARQT